MDDIFWFEKALQNLIGCNHYNWKTHEDDGSKIPNENRMQYKYVILTKEGLSMPSEEDVNAKKTELKKEHDDRVANSIAKKTSGKQKLKDLGLDDDEIQALIGV